MLHLKSLKLENFLSHKKTEIKFSEDQKLLIDGKSGSGKSSIVEAIIWGLYGMGRTDNKSLIKRGEKGACVTIVLADDKVNYKIERKINNKNKHELSVYEVKGEKDTPVHTTGVKNTQEYLEKDILKSSYLLFVNSIVYPQENTENFVRQTASKRKDIILEIIKAADYDEYLAEAKKKLQDIKGREDTVLSLIGEKENNIEEDEAKVKDLAELEKMNTELEGKKNKFKADNTAHEQRIEQLKKIQQELSKMRDKINLLEMAINKSRPEIEELKNKINEISKFDLDEINSNLKTLQEKRNFLKAKQDMRKALWKWKDDIQKILNEAPVNTDFDTPITDLNRQIITILRDKITSCPVINKPCPVWEEKKQKQVDYLAEQLKRKQEQKEEYNGVLEVQRKKIELLGPQPMQVDEMEEIVLENEINDLIPYEDKLRIANGAQSSIGIIQENIKKIELSQQENQKEITDIQNKIKQDCVLDGVEIEESHLDIELQKAETELKDQINRVDEITEKIKTNIEVLTIAREADKRIKKNQADIAEYGKEVAEINENKECLNLVKEAFGSNGIKSIVIDYIIPQLEDKINNILNKLSDFRIKLETQKSGLGKDVVLEGLFINIYNELGEEFDFDNYSGGEKLKIIVSISEALAEIQNIGFRVLDELFIGLDEESTESFAEVMETLQAKFSQLICISHLRTIKDLFEERLLITKTNGISTVGE